MGWFNHHLDDSVLIDTVDGSESLHQLRLVVYPTFFFTGFLCIPGGAGVLDSVLIDASSTPWKIKGWNQKVMQVDGSDDFPDFNWVMFR